MTLAIKHKLYIPLLLNQHKYLVITKIVFYSERQVSSRNQERNWKSRTVLGIPVCFPSIQFQKLIGCSVMVLQSCCV